MNKSCHNLLLRITISLGGAAMAVPALSYQDSEKGSRQWDALLQTGLAMGTLLKPLVPTITSLDDSQPTELDVYRFKVGGATLFVGGLTNLSSSYAISFGGCLLFDLANSQVSQQSGRVSVLWHVMGGPRSLTTGSRAHDFYMVSRWKNQFSLVAQGAILNYAASTKDLAVKISGSTFEARLGVRYRFDFSLLNGGGIELLTSIFSMPSDERRLRSQTSEMSVFWQF